MKFESENRPDGSFLLRAVPGEFDAVPLVDVLTLDRAPTEISPSRLGLAAYLAFGEFSSGELHFPRPIGPELAAAIDVDTAPIRLRSHGIDLVPKRLQRGERTIVIGTELCLGGPTARLVVASTAVAHGFLTWQQSTVVCSNSSILGTPSRSILAVAVLFADELEAGEFLFEHDMNLAENEMIKLQVLLQSVGLNLSHSTATRS